MTIVGDIAGLECFQICWGEGRGSSGHGERSQIRFAQTSTPRLRKRRATLGGNRAVGARAAVVLTALPIQASRTQRRRSAQLVRITPATADATRKLDPRVIQVRQIQRSL